MQPTVPDHIDADLLDLYLSDHLSGAAGGVSRFERMAKVWADTPFGEEFASLARQVGQESDTVREIISALGARPRRHRQVAVAVAERFARLKINRRPFRRSPMGLLLEVEIMRGAVLGKRGLWQTMTELAGDLSLPEETFATLVERSEAQIEVLERLHAQIRARAFRVTGD